MTFSDILQYFAAPAMTQDPITNALILPPPLAPGSVRVGVLSALPELIRSHVGTSHERIFEELGIPLDLLNDPANSIPFKKVGRLFDQCVMTSEVPHFGLLLGQATGPQHVGPLALLAGCAPNVKTALNKMILHVCVHDRGGAPVLITEGESAKLGYAIYEPLDTGLRYIYDASLSIMCNLMRSMCGAKWAPEEVHFSHSRPANTQPWEEFFRASLVFDAGMDGLVFREQWLEAPIPGDNRQAFETLLDQFENLQAEMNIGLREQVRSIVRPLIVTRNCSHQRVADLLLLHPRTLNRRLQEQDTSLRQIVGEVRYEMARQLLADSDATLKENSNFLGTSDSIVFSRSFSRWSNSTPTQWRRTRQLHPGEQRS